MAWLAQHGLHQSLLLQLLLLLAVSGVWARQGWCISFWLSLWGQSFQARKSRLSLPIHATNLRKPTALPAGLVAATAARSRLLPPLLRLLQDWTKIENEDAEGLVEVTYRSGSEPGWPPDIQVIQKKMAIVAWQPGPNRVTEVPDEVRSSSSRGTGQAQAQGLQGRRRRGGCRVPAAGWGAGGGAQQPALAFST